MYLGVFIIFGTPTSIGRGTDTLRLASQFGEVHDLSKVKTVVVDKYMNDIIALQKDMPQVSLQI